jgi:membrane-associated phospholipid phosphatase
LLRIKTMGSVSARTAVAGAAVAIGLYALLWLAWQQWGWLASVDHGALTPLHDFGVKHPAWVRFWDMLCAVLSPASFRVLGAVVIVVAMARRNVRAAVFVLATIGMSGVVTEAFKGLADRPRPSTALVSAYSTSFPSGHALGATVAVLALLSITWDVLGRRARIVLAVVGVAMVIAVSAGRVVLNVHNPSDVVAGWALGYLWFCLCWFLIRPRPLNAGAADGRPEVPDIDH